MLLLEQSSIPMSGGLTEELYAQQPNISSHATVNHCIQFVAPNGVHTQSIESYWNRTKIKLKCMRGCHSHLIPSYLGEFMWREVRKN
uniref:ISXO2-like transposase domain-containing protein n=1 Tax=Amphimedon queenslandica TaxID=400682 RepID=A0A1X7TEG2_AMPQE